MIDRLRSLDVSLLLSFLILGACSRDNATVRSTDANAAIAPIAEDPVAHVLALAQSAKPADEISKAPVRGGLAAPDPALTKACLSARAAGPSTLPRGIVRPGSLIAMIRSAGGSYRGYGAVSEQEFEGGDAITLVCIDESKEKVGTYRRLDGSGHGAAVSGAFVATWRVGVFRWPGMQPLGTTILRGQAPQELTMEVLHNTGGGPAEKLDEWLATGFSAATLIPDAKTASLSTIAFSGNGNLVALGDSHGGVTIWDTSSGHKLRRLALKVAACGNDVGEAGAVAMRFYETGGSDEELVMIDALGRISRWDVARGKETREDCVLGSAVVGAFSKSRMVAYAKYDGEFGFVDLSQPSLTPRRLGGPGKQAAGRNPNQGNICRLAFSPSGEKLAVGCHDDRRARVFDVPSGKEIYRVETATSTLPVQMLRDSNGTPDPYGMNVAVAWSPTGDELAVGMANGELVLASANGGAVQRVLAAPPLGSGKRPWGSPGPLRFGKSGRRLYAGDLFGAVVVWDVPTGTIEREIKDEGVADLALSPDGSRLGVASGGTRRLGRLLAVE